MFFLPLYLISDTLEVSLPTSSPLKPLYLSRFQSTHIDWRYVEELREVVAFDLNAGGFCSILPVEEALEEHLEKEEFQGNFQPTFWQGLGFPYVVAAEIVKHKICFSLFDTAKGTLKKYPEVLLTGNLEKDRRVLHKLTDQMHLDLFGVEGIASCKILYTCRSSFFSAEERRSEVWICDADGKNAKRLTSEKGYCVSPVFLPSSKNTAYLYVSFEEGQSKIYCASLEGPEKELFLRLRGSQLLPAISSDGRQLAFISDVAGRPDLFLQRLGPRGEKVGKPRQLFSAPRATQASPTFSPKGTQLAFVSDKDGPPRIYLLDLIDPKETKKMHPILLTKKNRENTSPAWSPDGTKLAYTANVNGVRQIWLYDFATGEESPLTKGEGMKENPSWAPDSIHLVYNTENDEACELYLLNIRNPEPLLISKNEGLKRFPCWETR